VLPPRRLCRSRTGRAARRRSTAIAAPVFDRVGQVLLSLSIAGPAHPVRADRLLELGRRLADEAAIATPQAKGRMSGQDTPRFAG
jgi:DNA-binding IclR family transcriptional regulator